MDYEAVIGLEVHAQLFTRSKIFCGCSTEFGAPPNTRVCPVCIGLPGVLPVPNRQVVEMALKTALALNFEIQRRSIWERKNYFYPDLPKGYQISQYAYPLARNGWIEIKAGEKEKRIGITRLHMEEDAGKLVHSEDTFSRANASFADFNRSGVPLMEIVSEPDIRSAQEAGAYLRALRSILVYLGVCDGNMEQGSLRCDANVSVRPPGSEDMGTRAEIKNMNSFRNVERALDYEIKRQSRLLESGKNVVQETRLWDDREGKTVAMRGKEESHDYRYFPDPDLLPLEVDEQWTKRLRERLPELPMEKMKRFVADYGIPEYDASVLTSERSLADYYEAALKTGADAKKTANWVMSELLRELKDDERDITDCPVSAEQLGSLVGMIDSGEITGKIGKTVFAEMYKTGKSPAEVIEEKGLKPMADEGEIGSICDRVIAENPKQVKQYREGKTKVLGFFVGQVMKASGGKADPQIVNRLLTKKLERA